MNGQPLVVSAHLPGMVASHTTVPALGVPVESRVRRGVDSLPSIVRMPAGIPVGTLAIGEAAASLAARRLSGPPSPCSRGSSARR